MKKYFKPQITDINLKNKGLAPLAIGAALAGGYAVGRVVKAIEIRPDVENIFSLERILTNE